MGDCQGRYRLRAQIRGTRSEFSLCIRTINKVDGLKIEVRHVKVKLRIQTGGVSDELRAMKLADHLNRATSWRKYVKSVDTDSAKLHSFNARGFSQWRWNPSTTVWMTRILN